MSLVETGLRIVAAVGLIAGAGCEVSPRPSVSGAEAVSPIPARQSIDPHRIVMKICPLLEVQIPAENGSQLIEGVERDSDGNYVRQCRVGSVVVSGLRNGDGKYVYTVTVNSLASQALIDALRAQTAFSSSITLATKP